MPNRNSSALFTITSIPDHGVATSLLSRVHPCPEGRDVREGTGASEAGRKPAGNEQQQGGGQPCEYFLTSFLKVTIPAAVLLLSSVLCNQPARAGVKDEISRQQQRINRVQKSILDHKEKLTVKSREEKELIKELKKIDYRIFQESKKYVKLEQRVQEQEDRIREQRQRLEELQQEKEDLKSQVQKRLTAYYQMGDIGIINAVFSASSLAELLNFREMYEHMLRHDRELFDSYKDKIRNITGIRKVLEKERRKLETAVSEARRQQNLLAEKRREREELLKKVKTEKTLYSNALAEMKTASRELQMTLADLEGGEFSADDAGRDGKGPITATKKIRPFSQRGFAAEKGRLPPPVSGRVIKKFHKDAADEEKFVFSEGINIKTEPGDEIRAVYRGEVIYAGMLPGYGKMIILDHGNHYITLVSGIADFIKEVGEQVEEGEKIATASYHSGLLQEGIHFEIRHKTEPIDPLAWLDPSELDVP